MKKYLFVSIILLFFSCSVVEPIDNYKNAVLYSKHEAMFERTFIILVIGEDSSKSEFKYVRLLKYDYDRYNIGDTIK